MSILDAIGVPRLESLLPKEKVSIKYLDSNAQIKTLILGFLYTDGVQRQH